MEQNQGTLGKRIMALRKAKGWTQEQLAAQLGISAQAVSKWENDVSCPDISTLPALAALLGCGWIPCWACRLPVEKQPTFPRKRPSKRRTMRPKPLCPRRGWIGAGWPLPLP